MAARRTESDGERRSEEREFFSSPQRRGGYLLFVIALGWVGVTWHRFAQGRLCPTQVGTPRLKKPHRATVGQFSFMRASSQQSRKTDTFGPFELPLTPQTLTAHTFQPPFGAEGSQVWVFRHRSSQQLESDSAPNFQTPWDLDQRPPILNS